MASRWSAEQQTQYRNEARNAGASDAWMDDYLTRNNDDHNRMAEAYASTNHRPYDSQSTNPTHMAANRSADVAAGSPLAGAWGGNNNQFGGSSGGSGGGGNSSTSSWTSSTGTGVSDTGGKSNALYDELMARSRQGLDVSRSDPSVRPQADAYLAQEERARRNYLSDTAESAGPGANMRGERRMAAERMGSRVGAFESELMGREIQARRDEIAQALVQRQGMLTTEQEMALRQQLAQMDNAISNRQLDLTSRGQDLNQDQFMRELGLRAENYASEWDARRSGLM